MMEKLNWKAIIAGFLIDLGGSFFCGFLMVIIVIIVIVSNGKSVTDIQNFLVYSIPIMIISLVIGFSFVILGGFAAGKIAGKYEIHNAITFGIISAVSGLFFIASLPLWYNIISYTLFLPMAYLGGHLARMSNKHE